MTSPAPSAVDTDRVRAQLKRWQERLLDLTKTNPLLGINRSRVSKLLVTRPDCNTLFGLFALEEEGKLTLPRVVKITRSDKEPGDSPDEQPDTADYRVEPGEIEFDAKPIDLLRRLRRIFDNARTTVEERGLTTLHLSFGVLKWPDPVLGESTSPLCLVPCEMEKTGPDSPLILRRPDEEMQFNPALELYLRERHGVQLPSLPEEPDAETLNRLFSDVATAVSDLGWRVEAETWLSTYTFESLVLYTDLKNLADQATHHPIVIGLARAGSPPEASEALGEETLDSLPTPDQVPVPVLPTDSSQLKALTLARSGRPLVVHGPPGTGKSQTIANLIADALAQNKRVLFVSAKMAALDVVYSRLKDLGLERSCLEAHSTKAGKAKIVEELRRTLAAAEQVPERAPEAPLADLLRLREELNGYVRSLHEPRPPLRATVFQAIGTSQRLSTVPSVPAPLPWAQPLQATPDELNAAVEALRDVAAQASVFDVRNVHPWKGLVAEDAGAPLNREVLDASLRELHAGLGRLQPEIQAFARHWAVPGAQGLSLEDLAALGPTLAELAALDSLPADWARRASDQLGAAITLLTTAASNIDELSTKRTALRQVLKVPPRESLPILERSEREFPRWHRVLKRSYWAWRRLARASLQPGVALDLHSVRSYVDRIRRVSVLEKSIKERTAAITAELGSGPPFGSETLRAAARRLGTAISFRTALVARGLAVPESNPPLTPDARQNAATLSKSSRAPRIRDAVRVLDTAWPGGFIGGVPSVRAPIGGVLAKCDELISSSPKLHEWLVLQHTLQNCSDIGLAPFIDALGETSAKDAPLAFQRHFYSAWASAAMDSSAALATFSGVRHEERIRDYRKIDEQLRRASLAHCKVAASAAARRVASAQSVGGAGDVAILRRELQKRKRIKPLRRLFSEIPVVLQALKPCFLMSPISVSTFLKADAMSFDLVVFDEASQLPTPQAIPAILRGRQVVVAGDRNQLPPTSFFDTAVIFDDGNDSEGSEELEPLESLLDDCVSIKPVIEETHLRWHYRSRDERLIRFSNHFFYQEQPLITFPAAMTGSAGRGVSCIYVSDGVWDRGRSRTNRAEARVVARTVVDQLTLYPKRSIGVVALNVQQREAIEESIDELLPTEPTVAPLLSRERLEPFFVKSLENVQGDERDTMIISVGYAKGPTGILSHNFGPLNQDSGWRRLNVLVTRARWQTILVTSMRSHELGGVNPNNRGACALRDFVAYAERAGELPQVAATVPQAETNDFEEAVAEALRARGLTVDEQVGTSEYRIDLAIRHPQDASRYLLGVECDGATYHGARTARDRDLARQLALRDLGWRLYRIWSTDWFRDSEQAILGVLRAVESAVQTTAEDVPLPPPYPARPDPNPPTTPPPSPKRFSSGTPYRKYRGLGSRETLLDPGMVRSLADQIVRVVDIEGPLHRDLVVERLKEVNAVGRAGSNVTTNIRRAIDIATRANDLEVDGDFLSKPGRECNSFRHPGDGVERPVHWIAPREIAVAVLHIVEEQFGYQRGALPKAIAEIFGFDRTARGTVEVVASVVDDLVERGSLRLSGPNVYLP